MEPWHHRAQLLNNSSSRACETWPFSILGAPATVLLAIGAEDEVADLSLVCAPSAGSGLGDEEGFKRVSVEVNG